MELKNKHILSKILTEEMDLLAFPPQFAEDVGFVDYRDEIKEDFGFTDKIANILHTLSNEFSYGLANVVLTIAEPYGKEYIDRMKEESPLKVRQIIARIDNRINKSEALDGQLRQIAEFIKKHHFHFKQKYGNKLEGLTYHDMLVAMRHPERHVVTGGMYAYQPLDFQPIPQRQTLDMSVFDDDDEGIYNG